MKMGVQVLVNDPEKLEGIRAREADIVRERVQMIMASGANVILTTQGIDDLCLKYFVAAGAMAVRRVDKDHLKRIARMTGGQVVMTLTNLEGEEEFDASNLGQAGQVLQERICDDEFILITDPKVPACLPAGVCLCVILLCVCASMGVCLLLCVCAAIVSCQLLVDPRLEVANVKHFN